MSPQKEEGSSKDTWQAWEGIYRRQPRTWRGPADISTEPLMNGIVLELGCGTGKTLRSLGDARLVAALDVSGAALRACRSRGAPGNAELFRGDVTRLPLRDSCVDFVLAHHVLGHLLAAERSLATEEITTVMRPGGLLSVRVLSPDDLRASEGEEIEPMTFAKGTGVFTHHFVESELESLFPKLEMRSMRRVEAERNFRGRRALRSEIVAEFERPGSG